jgi:RES domain-containing protein
VYHRISEFWRVGYHASPLEVSLEYQNGSGRFDDPEHELTVLYGGDSATTCILEVALPWKPHVDADYVQQAESPSDDMDIEEQRLALEQAERDREIAMRPPAMPVSLYENSKTFVQLLSPVILCDIDDVSVRTQLSKVSVVAAAMSACNVPQLDRSVITAQGPHLDITRAISGFLMRESFAGHRFAGIRTISRWKGEAFILFQGRYELGSPLVGPIRLNREDRDVVQAASMTGGSSLSAYAQRA